jgi:hypothetical protein
LLENFELDLTLALDPSQAAVIAKQIPVLHRELFLHTRQAGLGTVEPRAYLGDSIDLIRQFNRDARAGGPLQLYGPDAGVLPDPSEQHRAARARIQSVLSEYESQLDPILKKIFPGDRELVLKRLRAESKGEQAGRRELDQAAFERWHLLYMLNRQTSDRIASVLAAVDPQAASAWDAAVKGTTAPWLFKSEPVDDAAKWIENREGLAAEKKAEAQRLYADFATKRDSLRNSLLEFVVHQRVQLRSMIHPTGTTGARLERSDSDIQKAQIAIDARVHELIALEATTRVKLVRLLGDEIGAEMLRAISTSKRGRR